MVYVTLIYSLSFDINHVLLAYEYPHWNVNRHTGISKLIKLTSFVCKFYWYIADCLKWIGNSQSTSGPAQSSTDWLSSAKSDPLADSAVSECSAINGLSEQTKTTPEGAAFE